MITAEGIISYPAIYEPKANPSGAMKYSCSLLFDKGDTAGISELRTAIAKATAKGKETKWDGKLPKFRYLPLRDGDEELADGDKVDPVYKNKFFLNCSANTAPGVVDLHGKPLMDQSKLYAGCVVRGDVNPFPYKRSGNSGIGWGLNNIMVVADGPRLDGRMGAEDAFAGHIVNEEGEPVDAGELM